MALPGRAGLAHIRVMDRTPVRSSSVASVGYDRRRRVLEVEFLDGSLYQYDDVAVDEHDALLAAESKGAYFNAHIRERYPCRRL